MEDARKVRILEKLAFRWPFQWAWDAEKARVQRTINSARSNYEAGGTVEQRQINDDAATIPANLTFKDRLKDWVYRQPAVRQIWSAPAQGTPEPGGSPVAPIFTPPETLGTARANRALKLLEENKMTGFGPPSMPGYKDCSTFACQIAEVPKMSSDAIYADARGSRKYFREIPHLQMREGDFILYPGGINPKTKKRDFGHVAMYAGHGRVIDSSSSGGGIRYRQMPSGFLEHLEKAERGEGVAPIVARLNKDFGKPDVPTPQPGAQTPLVFQPGQYTPKRWLDSGDLSPVAPPLPVPKAPPR